MLVLNQWLKTPVLISTLLTKDFHLAHKSPEEAIRRNISHQCYWCLNSIVWHNSKLKKKRFPSSQQTSTLNNFLVLVLLQKSARKTQVTVFWWMFISFNLEKTHDVQQQQFCQTYLDSLIDKSKQQNHINHTRLLVRSFIFVTFYFNILYWTLLCLLIRKNVNHWSKL